MMEPVLLSSERTPTTLPAIEPADFTWSPPYVEPPHHVDLELRCLVSYGVALMTGFAHRRVLGSQLTFWSWIDGRCRLVHVSAWRRKA